MEEQLMKDYDRSFLIAYLRQVQNIDLWTLNTEMRESVLQEVERTILDLRRKLRTDELINWLRNIRETMSTWPYQETWLPNSYYRSLIIASTLKNNITLAVAAWEKISHKDTFHQGLNVSEVDLNNFQNITQKLDNFAWVSFWKWLLLSDSDIDFKKKFIQVFSSQVSKDNTNYWFITSGLTRIINMPHGRWFKGLEKVILNNWKFIDMKQVYLLYWNTFQKFKSESRFYNSLKKQSKEDKVWLWLQDWKFWISYKSLAIKYSEKLGPNIEDMNPSNLTIFIRSILPYLALVFPHPGIIIPTAWVGWYDDFIQANYGVNFDGTIQSKWERTLNYVTGILWLSIVWSWIHGGLKIAKGAKLVSMLNKILERINQLSLSWDLTKDQKSFDMIPAVMKYFKSIIQWFQKSKT